MEKKYKFWEMGAAPKRLSQYKGDKIKKGSHDNLLHRYSMEEYSNKVDDTKRVNEIL